MFYLSWKSHQNHRNLKYYCMLKSKAISIKILSFILGTSKMQFLFAAHKHDNVMHDNTFFLTVHCPIKRIRNQSLLLRQASKKLLFRHFSCACHSAIPVPKIEVNVQPRPAQHTQEWGSLGALHFYKTDVIAINMSVGNLTAEETYTSFAWESQCNQLVSF